ncbi:MAG TPA: class I SAM-dependent methyltransferase [Vicinamibacterales bacterium]|nr:class I SAM-dependent methyltransferase [Vicinamibacterales bacterium]
MNRLPVACLLAVIAWLGAGQVGAEVPGWQPAERAQQPAQQNPADRARDFWNKEFADGKVLLQKGPSPLLVTHIKGRKPGSALDIGMGQGRNAVYLAEQGWDVTGVDLSDVAVGQAKANAATKGVRLQAVVSDLDAFDFGTDRWDLITSFYMHGWHRRSPTDVPGRIYRALRPGGLLIVEGFREPPNTVGLRTEVLAREYGRMHIIRNENVSEYPAWYEAERTPLVFFVAEKRLVGR